MPEGVKHTRLFQSELKTKNAGSTKLNAPDICTVEVTVTDGMLTTLSRRCFLKRCMQGRERRLN